MQKHERDYLEFTPAELQAELRSLFNLIPPKLSPKGEPNEVDVNLITETLGVPEELASIPGAGVIASLIRRTNSEGGDKLRGRFKGLVSHSHLSGSVQELLSGVFGQALLLGRETDTYNACYTFLRLDSPTDGIFDSERTKEMAGEFINQSSRRGVFKVTSIADKTLLEQAKQEYREKYSEEP